MSKHDFGDAVQYGTFFSLWNRRMAITNTQVVSNGVMGNSNIEWFGWKKEGAMETVLNLAMGIFS